MNRDRNHDGKIVAENKAKHAKPKSSDKVERTTDERGVELAILNKQVKAHVEEVEGRADHGDS